MNKHNSSRAVYFRYLLFLIAAITLFLSIPAFGQEWRLSNPYSEVDWESWKRCRANFHTHTQKSDGRLTAGQVIRRYHSLGYDVLSITDHNKVTWPRADYGVSPDELDMLAIQGAEPSRHHDMGSYFCDVPGKKELKKTLAAVRHKNGLAIIFHPGRYGWKTEKYVRLFEKWDEVIGMEIYNQGDRYPEDRSKWDEVLTAMLPSERPVWGFSNDDTHKSEHIGRNRSILLLPELSTAAVRRALKKGRFFYVYAPQGHDGPPAPTINSLRCNAQSGVIKIDVDNAERVEWISEGQTVAKGNRVDLSRTPRVRSYVRAVVYGRNDRVLTGTQPIGLERKEK